MKDNCQFCNSPFTKYIQGTRKRFCSNICKDRNWKLNNPQRSSPYSRTIATSTVGAISELMASAALMKRGYEVHRALSAAAKSDLIAIKDDVVYRFEVRTAYYNKDKSIHYPKKGIRAENIIAVTHIDNKIHYFPKKFIRAFV